MCCDRSNRFDREFFMMIQEMQYSVTLGYRHCEESRQNLLRDQITLNESLIVSEFSDYRSPGVRKPDIGIGFINGIANSIEYAIENVNYIYSLAQGHSIELFYNQTDGLFYDLLGAMLSYDVDGASKEVNQLKEAWYQFDEVNKGNLGAKYLQICHSHGGAYVKKALEDCPQEIRDRVIVVNIAITTIIPRELCYQSYNYASENDYLNIGEMLKAYDPNLTMGLKQWAQMVKHRDEIVWLEGSYGPWWVPGMIYRLCYMHHEFRDPIFQQVIADHITDYLYQIS